jgi:hypothetical protein
MRYVSGSVCERKRGEAQGLKCSVNMMEQVRCCLHERCRTVAQRLKLSLPTCRLQVGLMPRMTLKGRVEYDNRVELCL